MTAQTRQRPHSNTTTTPFLLWNETTVSRDGAALACPQCANANLHIDAVHFAVPTRDHYTPTVGLSIDAHPGCVTADDHGQWLHAGQNRGPMVAVSYWCEDGCQGNVQLRQHKGALYASLHSEPPRHDDAIQDESDETVGADEPPF
jgi:hypothetical protein